MTTPHQLDWLADASFGRVVTHAPVTRARRTDVETSHAAAERAKEFAGEHEKKIAAYLSARPQGGTKDEIAAGTGLDAIAVARRMKGLCEHGGVYDSGERRPSATGRQSTVWRIRA